MSVEFAFLAASAVVPGIGAAHAAYQNRARRRSGVQTIVVKDESAATGSILSICGPLSGASPQHHDVVALRSDAVVEGDLVVSGSEHFRGPLKVTGDLEITGHAVFDGPVTVNGYVSVDGEAVFVAGLLCKSDLSVNGHARFGTDDAGSWCLARRIRGTVLPVAVVAEDGEADAAIA